MHSKVGYLGRDTVKVGDGLSLNIWNSKWLPRSNSFNIVTPFNPQYSLLKVSDFTNRDRGNDGWICLS